MIHLEKTYVSWFFNTIVKKLFLEMIYYYSMLLDIIIIIILIDIYRDEIA